MGKRDSSEPEAIFARFAVEVIEGDDVGKRVVSEGPEMQIGTAASNEMVLTDSTVSRHHCVIRVTDDGFLVTDLGSMNGIKLGGFRIREALLKDRCTVKLGRVKLAFTRVDGTVREKLSITEQFEDMVGASVVLRRLFARCRRIAASDRTILLHGEAGTGKRTMAESIHASSPRAKAPFVDLDLATLRRADVEPAIFGAKGVFARAKKGTVYIATIGALPIELQEVLTETLDDYAARLIVGTAQDLRSSVNRGRFRADLYRQLASLRLYIPPFRERPADVPLIARHLYASLFPKHPPPHDELISWLGKQPWWGNGNELRATIEREADAPPSTS